MPKFYRTEKFKLLDAKWRKRLKDSGFVDLEDEKGNLKSQDRRTIAWRNQERIRTFFTMLEELLESEAKVPLKERRILELYICGFKISGDTGISGRLQMNRSSVHEVIKKYKAVVLERVK